MSFISEWIGRRRGDARRREAATRIRGIRGAIDVEADDPNAVCAAVSVLVATLEERNGIEADRIISAIFTTTPDIRCMFPARAARDAGWGDVPLLCATEIGVPGSLPLCVRVLVHVELPPGRTTVEHVYLGRAAALRPDLSRGMLGAVTTSLHAHPAAG